MPVVTVSNIFHDYRTFSRLFVIVRRVPPNIKCLSLLFCVFRALHTIVRCVARQRPL